jgi:hypothetical protein
LSAARGLASRPPTRSRIRIISSSI